MPGLAVAVAALAGVTATSRTPWTHRRAVALATVLGLRLADLVVQQVQVEHLQQQVQTASTPMVS